MHAGVCVRVVLCVQLNDFSFVRGARAAMTIKKSCNFHENTECAKMWQLKNYSFIWNWRMGNNSKSEENEY